MQYCFNLHDFRGKFEAMLPCDREQWYHMKKYTIKSTLNEGA